MSLINFIKNLVPSTIREQVRRYKRKKETGKFKNYDAKNIFTEIYSTNFWGDQESKSGTGSNSEQTKVLVEELPRIFNEYNVTSVLDIPCGDFKWMQKIDLSEINYLGADIVDELISKNNDRYSGSNINFKVIDLINDELPEVDLIICRDCLVHLSDEHIKKSLANIKKSGSKFLMTTSYKDKRSNYNITTGDWRALNLEKKPFDFDKPSDIIEESCSQGTHGEYSDKILALWRVEDIP